MGVPGLWDVLRPAAHTRSLTQLSVVEGFERNANKLRGYRVGIDASIWFIHSEWGREGENPQLRTLLFRLVRLMNSPFLPLFVFDGPGRPSEKRGKKINRSKPHSLVDGMKRLIVAFGFEWRTAPGEAEAELAYLNRVGVIDAVISDDVDTFLFGATVVIRNQGANLTGNRSHLNVNSVGKQDDLHTTIYTATDLAAHPSIQLTQGGLILFGLLSGGDYHAAGLKGCGRNTAHALARCGFGDSLLEAAQSLSLDKLVEFFLPQWRDELRHELRTDSHGLIGRKCPALAKALPEDFPDVSILMCYTSPLTTEVNSRGRNKDPITWSREPCPAEIAAACELFFEWGYEEMMLYRFRSWLWAPLVCRILRRAALNTDQGAAPVTPTRRRNAVEDNRSPIGTPSKMIAKHFTRLALTQDSDSDEPDDSEERLVVKIHSERTHASTDGLLEYRLEIAPAQLVRLCRAGIRGLRLKPDDDDVYADQEGRSRPDKVASSDPYEHLRLWMPASMVKLAEPDLVLQWEDQKLNKSQKARAKGKAKPAKTVTGEGHLTEEVPKSSLTRTGKAGSTLYPEQALFSKASSRANEPSDSEREDTIPRLATLETYFKPSSQKLAESSFGTSRDPGTRIAVRGSERRILPEFIELDSDSDNDTMPQPSEIPHLTSLGRIPAPDTFGTASKAGPTQWRAKGPPSRDVSPTRQPHIKIGHQLESEHLPPVAIAYSRQSEQHPGSLSQTSSLLDHPLVEVGDKGSHMASVSQEPKTRRQHVQPEIIEISSDSDESLPLELPPLLLAKQRAKTRAGRVRILNRPPPGRASEENGRDLPIVNVL